MKNEKIARKHRSPEEVKKGYEEKLANLTARITLVQIRKTAGNTELQPFKRIEKIKEIVCPEATETETETEKTFE